MLSLHCHLQDGVVLVVCAAVQVEGKVIDIEGSKIFSCADCGKELKLSPATLERSPVAAVPVCAKCGMKRAKESPIVHVDTFTPEQIREQQAWGVGVA